MFAILQLVHMDAAMAQDVVILMNVILSLMMSMILQLQLLLLLVFKFQYII